MKELKIRCIWVFIICFNPFVLLGQTATLEKTENAINNFQNILSMKLWKKVMDGEVQAFRNDSLRTKITPAEIEEKGEVSGMIYTDNLEILEQETTIQYLPGSLRGWIFSIEQSYHYKSHQVTYKPVGFALSYSSLTFSGIDLGKQPAFWVKLDDVKKLMNSEELNTFEAVIGWRMQIGDFYENEWGADYHATTLNAQRRIDGSKIRLEFDENEVLALTTYLLQLPSRVFANNVEDFGRILFKDEKLKQPFENVRKELGRMVNVSIQKGDFELYEMIDTTVLIEMDLYEDHFLIHSGKGIWKLDYTLEDDLQSHLFYFKESDLKNLLHTEDFILFKKFLIASD